MKTAKEALIDLYYKQDSSLKSFEKYQAARQEFREKYNLQPPLSSHESFKQTLYNTRKK